MVREGTDIALLALGNMVEVAMAAGDVLEGAGVSTSVINARFAKPLDGDFLEEAATDRKLVVTLEDNVVSGGFGSGVLQVLNERIPGVQVMIKGLPDSFVEHGATAELLKEVGLDAERVAADVLAWLGTHEKKA